MVQEQSDAEAIIAAETAKKALKAEAKAAEKAKKIAKIEKKLAKQAGRSAKDAEKAQRKIDKQQVKLASSVTLQSKPIEPKKIKTTVPNPDEARPAKAKPVKAKSVSDAPLNLSLGAKLQSVARLARSNLAANLLKHGLYAGQEQVLFLLDDHGPMALAELAEKLDVRAPTITKTVTRMEAQGFLSRAVSRDDARSVIIALAPEGRRVLKIGRQIVHDIEMKTFSVLSKTDCESLKNHLDLVLSQLKQQ